MWRHVCSLRKPISLSSARRQSPLSQSLALTVNPRSVKTNVVDHRRDGKQCERLVLKMHIVPPYRPGVELSGHLLGEHSRKIIASPVEEILLFLVTHEIREIRH